MSERRLRFDYDFTAESINVITATDADNKTSFVAETPAGEVHIALVGLRDHIKRTGCTAFELGEDLQIALEEDRGIRDQIEAMQGAA